MSDNYPVDGELRRQAERIEVLEQAHAELAAEMASRFRDHSGMIVGVLEEVNRLRTRYEAHLLVHELDALESDAAPDDSAETPAQQRYREANERHYSNREVEMAAGAFDRAEEVAQELDDWTHLIHMRLNTMSIRLTALESPAPAPDPVCQCGHEKSRHMYFACHKLGCTCTGFVPAAEPAPLDPIEKTVECTNCGHPVWFIAGENEPHPCTDCGTVNSREQPDIFDEDDVAGIDNYLTDHPGTLDVLEGISRFLGKIDRPEDIDLWEFDCFIAAIRSYGRDGAR